MPSEYDRNARPHRKLNTGERGADVRKLQAAINLRLKYMGSRRRISTDGTYGPGTHDAFGDVAYRLGLAHRKPTEAQQLLVRSPTRRTKAQKRAAEARRPKRPAKGQLTKNFHLSEFNCKDGTPVPSYMEDDLRRWCQVYGEPLRTQYGSAAINSGYRHYSYNRHIGGEDGSYHVYEARRSQPAVDAWYSRGGPTSWGATAKSLRSSRAGGNGGVGIYPSANFIHCDTRAYQSNWWG